MGYKTKGFNDGIVEIYKVVSTAVAGKTPKKGIQLKETLRYRKKTVGVTRFYSAKQNNSKADRLIECLLREAVTATDVAIFSDGKQYQIIQLQYPEETRPPTMLITLERLGNLYDIPKT